MLGLLEIDYSQKIESVGERLLFGGQMLLIGMAVVFAVLILLWFSLELFRIACDRMKGEYGSFSLKNFSRAKPEAVEPKSAVPAPEKKIAVAASAVAASVDTEIIAVITAAIAASENAPLGSFRVVSFRRV